MPSIPSSPIRANASRGNCGLRSRSAAVGASSRAANSRAVSRTSRWPSVSMLQARDGWAGRSWRKLAGPVFWTVARIDRRNSAEYWWDRHLTGLSLLRADFTPHEYPPHVHEALVVAITEQGGSVIKSRGHVEEATPSTL